MSRPTFAFVRHPIVRQQVIVMRLPFDHVAVVLAQPDEAAPVVCIRQMKTWRPSPFQASLATWSPAFIRVSASAKSNPAVGLEGIGNI